jgi:hypothetical protein
MNAFNSRNVECNFHDDINNESGENIQTFVQFILLAIQFASVISSLLLTLLQFFALIMTFHSEKETL